MTDMRLLSRLTGRRNVLLTATLLLLAITRQATSQQTSATVVVTVNGSDITQGDIEAAMRSRDIPKDLWPTLRKAFAERLVDERLMQTFLTDRKIAATKDDLDAAVRRAYAAIRRAGKDPADLLTQRGQEEAAFRRQLVLSVMWGNYARQIVTNTEVRDRFRQRSHEYDGTRLRARQIVITFPKDANDRTKQQAVAKLEAIRSDILAGKITFADAAKTHSTSPSNKNGGDVGLFAYRGTMPVVITKVAFALKENDLSLPFLTPFGAHLVQVTERKPGQLSLEDVRPTIFQELSQERWHEIVGRQQKSAKIEWKVKL